MEPNDTNEFNTDMGRLRMTEKERALLRARLMEHAERAPAAGTASPYYRALVGRMRWYGALAATLIIIAAVPTSYAAERSLPGDALYFVKTEILEPLEETFAFGSHRTEVELNNAENRIAEQIALVRETGAATDAGVTRTLFSEKARKIQKGLATMKPEDLDEKIELQKELLTVLDAYVAVFEVSATNTEPAASSSIAAEADVVEDQLRASIDAFIAGADEQEVLDEIADEVDDVRIRLNERAGASPGEDDGNALLEQTLSAVQDNLSARDFADALETLILSDHTGDVIEKLGEIQEAADALGEEDGDDTIDTDR